jgi:hypothetical protein
MTGYKKSIVKLVNMISEEYFSVERNEEEEKYAAIIFAKFIKAITNDDDVNIMYMLLKVIMVEGVMLNGARRLNNDEADA